MIELPYSLVIEATDEPDFFGFYSPDLEGFTGNGHYPNGPRAQAERSALEYARARESSSPG